MMHPPLLLLTLLFFLLPLPVNAQLESNTISPLLSSDIEFMDTQRRSIDDLARRYLGMRLRGTADNDMEILQKLLTEKLIKNNNTLQLQAMGIILGDIYIKQLGVHWVVLKDKMGRSRALQADNQQQLLFPITMISRRVEVGIEVNIKEIYQTGYQILEPLVRKGTYRHRKAIN